MLIRIPPTWKQLPVAVFHDGHRLVLVGDPPPERSGDNELDPLAHNCDQNGCGQVHVLVTHHATQRDLANLGLI